MWATWIVIGIVVLMIVGALLATVRLKTRRKVHRLPLRPSMPGIDKNPTAVNDNDFTTHVFLNFTFGRYPQSIEKKKPYIKKECTDMKNMKNLIYFVLIATLLLGV